MITILWMDGFIRNEMHLPKIPEYDHHLLVLVRSLLLTFVSLGLRCVRAIMN